MTGIDVGRGLRHVLAGVLAVCAALMMLALVCLGAITVVYVLSVTL
jgi:hypothetical protein